MKAQQHNAQLIETLAAHFVKKPERFGAVIRRSGSHQSIPDTTVTSVVFDDNNTWPATYDRALTYSTGMVAPAPYPFWAVANPERLTVPAPANYALGNLVGEYLVEFHLVWEVDAVGYRMITLYVVRIAGGGAVPIARDTKVAHAGDVAHSARKKLWLNPGDYVFAQLWQNSGGALNAISISEYSLFFSICMLR